ncbi:MAG: ATP-binding cassette domain-containing protein, partial [Dehalococcoidia bacterium]|nr:ATP-binding cassette domain-containing protein [Dehalococcoidia bacterium]
PNGTHPAAGHSSTGLILQDYGLLPWLTAIDNVALGLKIRGIGKGQAVQSARQWMTKLGIDSVASHYPAELSGGQRQRVAIARTLALKPDLLLMDEPFASLDALTREELQNLIISLWASLSSTIILVTHNIEEAVFLGRRIMVLSKPPNKEPVIIENQGSGSLDYRKTPDFVTKCHEVRGVIEKMSRSGAAGVRA